MSLPPFVPHQTLTADELNTLLEPAVTGGPVLPADPSPWQLFVYTAENPAGILVFWNPNVGAWINVTGFSPP